MKPPHTILTLPGWMGSDAGHWQTRWEQSQVEPCERVEQDDWARPIPEAWERRLEARMSEAVGEVSLVAHSLGCHLIARWAATSIHVARVRIALLVAPPDLERADAPPELRAWAPLPDKRLPFRSVVAYSTDDPYCTTERSLALAARWGSTTRGFGPRGHLNSESGLGDWREGYALLGTFDPT